MSNRIEWEEGGDGTLYRCELTVTVYRGRVLGDIVRPATDADLKKAGLARLPLTPGKGRSAAEAQLIELRRKLAASETRGTTLRASEEQLCRDLNEARQTLDRVLNVVNRFEAVYAEPGKIGWLAEFRNALNDSSGGNQ